MTTVMRSILVALGLLTQSSAYTFKTSTRFIIRPQISSATSLNSFDPTSLYDALQSTSSYLGDIDEAAQSSLPSKALEATVAVASSPAILILPIFFGVSVTAVMAFGLQGYSQPEEAYDSSENSKDTY